MIKLFVTDLDHTLLNDDKQVDIPVQIAVQKLIDAGVEIGVASGRTDEEIRLVGEKFLNFACHRISENGVFVFTGTGEELFSTTLPQELVHPIMEKANQYHALPVFNVNKECYVLQKADHVEEYEKLNAITIHEAPDLLERLDDSFLLTKIAFIGELPELKQLEKDMHQYFPHQMNIHISSPNCLDLVPKQSSKGIGVQKIIEKYDIQPNEVASVGDSYNDISMFQITPHSFAMKHAEQQVRDAAKYTVSSVTEVVDYILQLNQATLIK